MMQLCLKKSIIFYAGLQPLPGKPTIYATRKKFLVLWSHLWGFSCVFFCVGMWSCTPKTSHPPVENYSNLLQENVQFCVQGDVIFHENKKWHLECLRAFPVGGPINKYIHVRARIRPIFYTCNSKTAPCHAK